MLKQSVCMLGMMVLLGGCVTEERVISGSTVPDARPLGSTVVTKESEWLIPKSGTYGWAEHRIVVASGERMQGVDVGALVREEVSADLATKGFQPAAAGNSPDITISYAISFSDEISDEELVKRFGVNPGYHEKPGQDKLEKGTLVIEIVRDDRARLIYRAAVQAGVIPDLPGEERERRLRKAVRSLMDSFP